MPFALARMLDGDSSLRLVRAGLAEFVARTGADELMVTSQIFDHQARLRSFQIAIEARDE